MLLLLVPLVTLVAVVQCQTILEVDVSESRAFHYSIADTEINNCYITLPSGNEYELLPNSTVISLVDERYTVSSSNHATTCGLAIDFTSFSDSGSYSLNITDTNGISHQSNYVLRVQERTSIWPSSAVNLVASETAYIFLSGIEGTIQTCYVTPPGGEEIEIGNDTITSSGIKQWSPSSNSWCGVEIMNISNAGYWKLTAALNATHFYYNRTLLELTDSSTTADTWKTVTSVVGQNLTDYIGHENASYCQLTNPQGVVDHLVTGRCSFNLSVVTSQHNGTWIATTGLKGSTNEITEKVDVNVEEIPYIYAGSTKNTVASGAIDLYCRVHNIKSEICRFVSPTDTGISIIPGVGNDKYAPYYDPEGVYTCGLTILELSNDDYGTWTCYTGNTSDVRVGYISVTNTEAEDVTRSSSDSTLSFAISDSYNAYSVYNESLTLSCSAMTELSYCWFRHPNGTHYPAVPDVTDVEQWAYSGDGLSLGSCAITFTHSTYNDAGSWTCNMGISGKLIDVSVNITVKIASSALTVTSVDESSGTATAVCTVIDNTKALSYCRFIRPDGVGINAAYGDSNAKYSLIGNLSQGTCGLTISNTDDVDIGTWVCAGRLQSVSSEFSDTFTLSSAPEFGLNLLLLGAAIVFRRFV